MKTTLFLLSTLMAFFAVNTTKAGYNSQNAAAKPTEYPVYFVDTIAASRWSDNQFLTAAYNQNTFEIKAAKHAHEQAGDPKIKAFANVIKNGRETIGTNLQSLMQKKGVQAPTEVPAELEGKFKYLNEWMGKEFNTKYVDGLMADSKNDIALYNVFARRSKDADVRFFAKQSLTQFRTDQDSAASILKHIDATSNSKW